MRPLTILLLLALAAPNLAAQHRSEPSLRSEAAQLAPLLPGTFESAEPLRTQNPSAEVQAESAVNNAAAQQAVLDEAFWRSILAGVIVTVVSTLILRAIL